MSQVIKEPSFRESVDLMVDRAMTVMKLDPGTAIAIKSCNAVLQVRFPVKIRGKIEVFTGWRAVHSTHRLPAKGGIRFAPFAEKKSNRLWRSIRLSEGHIKFHGTSGKSRRTVVWIPREWPFQTNSIPDVPTIR